MAGPFTKSEAEFGTRWRSRELIERRMHGTGPAHVSRVAEAVQHDDGRTLIADPDVEGRTVAFDLFGVKIGW
jgi:hypothetical protein